MVSDLTYFYSDKAYSELTGETDQERFHKRWDKIIQSGMTTAAHVL